MEAAMTDTINVPTRDDLEATARRLMAQHHEARGWDTGRERAEWLADVDQALDDWLEMGHA